MGKKLSDRSEEFAGNFPVRFVNYFVQVQYVRNVSEKIKLVEGEWKDYFLSVSLIQDGGI